MNSNQTLFDIHANSILAATYSDPAEVLTDPVLSSFEKRYVLAAWSSDAFAVENSPWLRQLPGSPTVIPIGRILSALRELDEEDEPPPLSGAPALRLPCSRSPKWRSAFKPTSMLDAHGVKTIIGLREMTDDVPSVRCGGYASADDGASHHWDLAQPAYPPFDINGVRSPSGKNVSMR